MSDLTIPRFQPHPCLPGGHLQTLAGFWLRGHTPPRTTVVHHCIQLPDGDRLVLHEDAAPGWRPGDPVALFVHGLCGSADSPAIRRIAAKLRERQARTFRLDMRGCGAGRGLARHPYHAGRSDDIEATVQAMRLLCPGSLINVIGVSLGGNIVLKWLGEQSFRATRSIGRVIAVNPPIDLQTCSTSIGVRAYGIYDRYFARMLARHVRDCPELSVHNIWINGVRPPRQMREFDETFTAPRSGFSDAVNYYKACSAIHRLRDIAVPTLILTSRDDPVVPVHIFDNLNLPASVRLHIVNAGGHLGYVGRRGDDADGWWLDWRIVDWFTGKLSPGLVHSGWARTA